MLKPGRAPSDEVIALLSRRLPPVRSSICLIAIAVTAAGLLHPITASAATQADHAAHKAAAVHNARKHPPTFHVDKTPLGADVTGAGSASGTAPAAVGSAGADVIRTIVGLAVVLGVIYGVYWLLKSAARAKSGRADERIGVIATTPLAPNRSLHLVRAGDELILVGATDHAITPLRVYAADEAMLIERVATGGDMALSLPPATPLRRNNLLENLRKRTARA
jgi:flagellar biosynthetic protein FliO